MVKKTRSFTNYRILFWSMTITAIIGIVLLLTVRAQVPVASLEAEQGTRSSHINEISNGDTSAGKAIEFKGCPSGECLPIGDLTGWQQIFTDDFNNDVPFGSFPSAVSNKWKAYPFDSCYWQDTSKNGHYWPEKTLTIKEGILKQYIHTENGPLCGGGIGPIHAVAALSPILPGSISNNGQLYGRYAVRFKSDSLANYKTAWLLWPDSETWPRDGEIDFPEGNLNGTISGFMHKMNGTSGTDQDSYSTSALYTSWHTAIIEWSPNDLKFILDGQIIGHSTSRVPSTPMHWVLQTETALDGIVPDNLTAGNVLIDWVAVWKKI